MEGQRALGGRQKVERCFTVMEAKIKIV